MPKRESRNDVREGELRITLDLPDHLLPNTDTLINELKNIMITCELIEMGDFDSIVEYFSTPALPNRYANMAFRPARYDKIMEQFHDKYIILDVSKGSLFITLGGIPTIVAILMPIVALVVNNKIIKYNEELIFNIESSEYDIVSNIIESFHISHGFNVQNIKFLFNQLRLRGYDFRATSKNIYTVSRTLDAYSKHIPKIIYPNRKP